MRRDMMICSCPPSYLLWRDIKRHCPHVHTSEVVHTGNYKEYSRALQQTLSISNTDHRVTPLGSSFPQSSQSEDDGPLVLLDHLHTVLTF